LAVLAFSVTGMAGEFDLKPLPGPPAGWSEPTTAQLERMLAPEESLQWHRDAKLGISIHWGPVALTGAPMSWGRYGPRPGAGRPAANGIPMAEYDRLYERFNPVEFDADEWVGLFRRAGARYFYFTAKHHDGFCMWDTATTDYDIMSTPFQRDVAAELAAASHDHGVKLFWYYSQPDWVHPNALQEGHYEHYLPYMQRQVDELLNNYGTIDGLWFDHLGSRHYHWNSVEWLPELREAHLGLLFNNRIGHGLEPKYQGDWFVYELRVGPWEEARHWESNTTLSKAWAWHGGDLVKPFESVLRLFLQVVGNGGNLLLNLGPTPEGAIAGGERAVLERLGAWLDDYGEAVYATRKGPFRPGPWGVSARKGKEVFLYVLEQHAGTGYGFELPALGQKPVAVELLTPGRLVADLGAAWWSFDLADKSGMSPAILRLVFETDVGDLAAVDTYPESRKRVLSGITSSSDRNPKYSAAALQKQSSEGVFGEGIHIKNWWAPASTDMQPSLEIALERSSAVHSLMISESIRTHAVREFEVSYAAEDGTWQPAFTGSSIGEMLFIRLDAPLTDRIRIVFKAFEDSVPNITAVELFAREI
jgi:hypothetical protein